MLGSFDVIAVNFRFLWQAILTTFYLSIIVCVLAAAFGALVGIARFIGPVWLNRVLGFVVDSLRAMPIIVVLLWLYLSLPSLVGTGSSTFALAACGLGAHIGAYFSEIVRGGLFSVSSRQTEAGRVLGMNSWQVLTIILVPQAMIRMIPATASLVTGAIKDTATASVIAVPELMRQSQILAAQEFRPFEVFGFAGAVYFIMCFPLVRLAERYYTRVSHKGAA